MENIRTVTIVGAGLIGGSFALALRRAGFPGRILGVGSERTLARALELGVIDAGVSLEEGAARGDLLYLAHPISRILDQLPEVARHIRPGTLTTDAGSTKRTIVETAERHFPPGAFLGGHPMAGKESRGVESADAALFEGRTYIVTPARTEDMEQPLVREFTVWLEKIGARLLVMSPEQHDKVVSLTSHLAQMASTALGKVVLDNMYSTNADYSTAGPGLLDMTRLAMSSYEVWKDIIATNHDSIVNALDAYIDLLQKLRDTLGSRETATVFEDGARLARLIRSR
ncbi:MAG: prephenate dehydrogenase [Bryobacterales bacterium]|nr:prephenate dehydrogenase [Bryobacterales bacterium]